MLRSPLRDRGSRANFRWWRHLTAGAIAASVVLVQFVGPALADLADPEPDSVSVPEPDQIQSGNAVKTEDDSEATEPGDQSAGQTDSQQGQERLDDKWLSSGVSVSADSCLTGIELPDHFGPYEGQPYISQYTGDRRAAVRKRIDPTKLYAVGTLQGQAFGPVSALPETEDGEISTIQQNFRDTVEGRAGTVIGDIGGNDGPWGSHNEDMSTMALDGGGGLREGTSYFWYWGNPRSSSQTSPSRPAPASGNIPVSVFSNELTGEAADHKPNSILFVPRPGTSDRDYWSGGEVHQPSGRIYFTGGEDTKLRNDGRGMYRLMIFDPKTGDYFNPGDLLPKTPEDGTRFHDRMPASDVAIDAAGHAYTLVSGSAKNPGSNNTQTTKWLVKLEPHENDPSRWVYSGVVPLWNQSGGHYNPTSSDDIWGMAFKDGKLYLSGIRTSGGGAKGMSVVDPLSGILTNIPGESGLNIYDLASVGSMATMNGTVFVDANRNGVQDAGEQGSENQLVQLHDSAGKVVGRQLTTESGEYSFLLPPEPGQTYRVRVVQPRLDGVNAAQTGVTTSSLCDQNLVSAGSFGKAIGFSMPPTDPVTGHAASYVDYPEQTGVGTAGAESLSPEEMAMYGEVLIRTDLDVSTVDFGISRQGSWGDSGNNASTFNTMATANGPRHLGAGDSNSGTSLRLGVELGQYLDGTLDDSHDTDDGVTFLQGGSEVSASNVILAAGVSGYKFSVDVQGSAKEDASVRAWLSNRNANTFPGAPTATRQGPGEITIDVPAGAVTNSSVRSFLRVNATSSDNEIDNHYNTATAATMNYAPAAGSEESKTSDWVIDGEVEGYPVMVANAVARINVEGVPGAYAIGAPSNTVVSAPSGVASSGTVPVGGASTQISSHAVTNASNDVTFEISSMPADTRVVGVPALLDLDGNPVAGHVTSFNPVTRQVTIPAGAFAAKSDITVRIETAGVSTITGTKLIGPITAGTLPDSAAPSDWEITATQNDGTVTVISGGAPVNLIPNETYKIGEQTVDGASSEADTYAQHGPIVCTQADGTPLPAEAFDPNSGRLEATESGLEVACSITNAAAQITLVNSLFGTGGTAGWSVHAKDGDSQLSFNRDDGNDTGLVRPSTYELSVVLPSAISLIALERLDTSVRACANAASDPDSVSKSCWIKVTAAEQQGFVVAAGTHQVLRLSGATHEDIPALPITGGVGTYVFVMIAGGLLAAAVVAFTFRHQRLVMAHRRF